MSDPIHQCARCDCILLGQPTDAPAWCRLCIADLEDRVALDAVRAGTYRCVACGEREVYPAEGEDTCSTCLEER